MPNSQPAPPPHPQDGKRIILALMAPMLMMVLNMSMFNLSLPTLRQIFELETDMVAWLVTAYSLPMMLMMPLYGRLGDGLGKRRLFMIGVGLFLLGSITISLAPSLTVALLGRTLQGLGAGSVNPLSLAIISERFSLANRGKALGTWNSAGPLGGLIGPLLGGLIIDTLGWRFIFIVVIALGLMSLLALNWQIPAGNRRFINRDYFQNFDGIGFGLLALSLATFIVFTSSRPITGVAALQDWRLLGLGTLFVGLLWVWEQRHPNPFVPLALVSNRPFMWTSIVSALRMWTLISTAFLETLYLTDVWALNATQIGMIKFLTTSGLFLTMRFGGSITDRLGGNYPIMVGLGGQAGALLLLAIFAPQLPLAIIIALLVIQGLSAGFSLAALHQAALLAVPVAQLSVASGFYAMIRAGGMVVGVALVGVLLQSNLNRFNAPLPAYQLSYAFTSLAAFTGFSISLQLRKLK